MNNAKAIREWMGHILTARTGSQFEVGLCWDVENGWRVYQRIGEKGISQHHGEFLRVA